MNPREPIRRPTFLILAALAEEPRHGYGIMQRARELSDGELRLAAGTLYGALDRLAERGLVELDREEVHEGRARRYYRLTGDGESLLGAEVARLAADATVGRRALDRGGARPVTGGGT